MKWYYSDGGKQIGPIDETELNRLVTLGTVRSDTLVWHEGLASWQPLGVVRGMHSGCGRGRGPPLRRILDPLSGARHRRDHLGRDQCLIVRIPLHADVRRRDDGHGRLRRHGRDLRRWPDFWTGDGGRVGNLDVDRLALGAAYEVYFLSAHGATPGKMALGLRVIRADGGPISPMLALGRHFADVDQRDYSDDRLHHGGFRPREARLARPDLRDSGDLFPLAAAGCSERLADAGRAQCE